MYVFNTTGHEIRSIQKCFSIAICLIFVFFVSQVSCRPSEVDDISSHDDRDYIDADDIEWKNFPAMETATKVHPIIYYKEDMVSEDYDPKNDKKATPKENEKKTEYSQKYKEIFQRRRQNHTENYRYVKPEKVYFDVYPIEDDEIGGDDNAFKKDDNHVEVISLLDENINKNNDKSTESKSLYNEVPKKYHHKHRQRRDLILSTTQIDEPEKHTLRHKRNPYIKSSHYANQLPHYRGVFFHPQVVIYPVNSVKHSIKSPIYHNPYSPSAGKGHVKPCQEPISSTTPGPGESPDSITTRFDTDDRPVWGSKPMATQRPALPPRRTPPPIVHSGDDDYVEIPNETVEAIPTRNSASGQPRTSPRPTQQRPKTTRPTQSRTPQPQSSSSKGVSACIWAISSCCTTRNQNIRYQCFERLGCNGSFWDLNPCAEDIFRVAVEAAEQYLD